MIGPKPQLAVGAIVLHDKAVLLVERAQQPARGRWTIPGGKVEAGERLVDAVEREVLEETGLAVDATRFVGWVERMGPGYHYVIMDFEATLTLGWDSDRYGQPAVSAGDDAADVRWVELEYLRSPSSEHPLVDGLGEFLEEHGYFDDHP